MLAKMKGELNQIQSRVQSLNPYWESNRRSGVALATPGEKGPTGGRTGQGDGRTPPDKVIYFMVYLLVSVGPSDGERLQPDSPAGADGSAERAAGRLFLHMSPVAWSVCLCVVHRGELCNNRCRGGFRGVTTVTSMGSRNHALDGARPGPSTGRGTVGRHVPLNNKRVQLMSWHCV